MSGCWLYMVTTYEFSAKCVVVGLTLLLIGRAGIYKRELDGERAGARENWNPLETFPLNLNASYPQPSEHKGSALFTTAKPHTTTCVNFNLKS